MCALTLALVAPYSRCYFALKFIGCGMFNCLVVIAIFVPFCCCSFDQFISFFRALRNKKKVNRRKQNEYECVEATTTIATTTSAQRRRRKKKSFKANKKSVDSFSRSVCFASGSLRVANEYTLRFYCYYLIFFADGKVFIFVVFLNFEFFFFCFVSLLILFRSIHKHLQSQFDFTIH